MRFLFPLSRNFTIFDLLVLFPTIALNRHRNKRGIDDLATFGFIASRLQILLKLLEQFLD
jgi:hypothetical protein